MFQLIITMFIMFLGKRFFINGFRAIIYKSPNMDTLVALSSTASFIYSVVMTFLLTENPSMVHHLYYESAAIVITLVSVGKYIESKSKAKTKDSIEKLLALAPNTAIIVDEKGQREVPTETINVGDTILVKPGAKVPLDGIVTDGNGSINESMLTGESMPIEKQIGDSVIGGSVSINGALYVKVTHIGEDTTLSKIIRFVEDAQGKKAPIAKIADNVSGVFVPIVIVIAVLSAVIWLLVGEDFSFAIKIFTSVLVIACPCSLGLATPTAIVVGTGLGASHGILIRSGEALEKTYKTNVAIFDKTGTVTVGNPTVTDIISNLKNQEELLSIAFPLEKLSDHPIAKAICNECENRNLKEIYAITNFENHIGKGITANLSEGKTAIVGNIKLMKENNIDISEFNSQYNNLLMQGKTVIFVAVNSALKGLISISDKIKENAKESLYMLKQRGIKTVLLTGDNKLSANYIGNIIGADEIISEVLPTQKAEVVKRFQQEGKTVMMIGDGINDAPALAQADIGCAIGNGSDIAIDSAQIVLMKNDISHVSKAINLSHLTIRNIKQNLFWAFCYNVLGIPIAAGVLYKAFGILLSPMIGGIAMSLSSIFVVGNALRLRSKKI